MGFVVTFRSKFWALGHRRVKGLQHGHHVNAYIPPLLRQHRAHPSSVQIQSHSEKTYRKMPWWAANARIPFSFANLAGGVTLYQRVNTAGIVRNNEGWRWCWRCRGFPLVVERTSGAHHVLLLTFTFTSSVPYPMSNFPPSNFTPLPPELRCRAADV